MADTSTPDARPDLFAGASARDDSYRILARLAHGGALPEPSLRFDMNSLRNARPAAAVALIALAGAAWILMRDGGHQTEAPPPAAARGAASGTAAALPPSAGAPLETQAAAIINVPEPAVAPPAAQPAPERRATPATARSPAVAANARKPAKRAAENDEDVTLLAAMLKHAGKPKTPPTRPAEE